MMRSALAPCLVVANLLLASACSDSSRQGEPATATLVHDFGEHTLEPLQEIDGLCIQWTLHNEKPLYVNTVTVSNGGGYHHSNWFVVPEDQYAGPDEFFDCDERGFGEVAAAVKGTVIFAQSTQSQVEEQKLTTGAVIKIPPRHKIMANTHLLNLANRRVVTPLRMALDLVHPRDVVTVLAPFRLSYLDLHIPPRSEAHFTEECDLRTVYEKATGAPFDLKLYWVLPHYHYLGNYFRVEVLGGPDDGKPIHTLETFNAEANGKALDPPLDLSAARGLRLTCGYGNPRDEEVGWGIGDQEMCVMLGFADSKVLMDASVVGGNRVDGIVDGVVKNSGPCGALALQKNPAQTMPDPTEVAAPLYVPEGANGGDDDLPPVLACIDYAGTTLPEAPISLSSIRENIFDVSCGFTACHDSVAPAGGLDLTSDSVYENLIGHRVLTADTSLPLIAAGDPDRSWLVRLLAECDPKDDSGRTLAHMPRNSPILLDGPLVAKVRAWIESGAPNN